MPLYRLPSGKWKWGEYGKEHDTKEQAEAQGRAATALRAIEKKIWTIILQNHQI